MPALGERFRAAREARGLSLSDVAEQIRIRSVYLAAIEDENWSAIGAPVYIRGFLRTYGRFLGLDTEEIVAAFNGETPGGVASAAPAAATSSYVAGEPAPARHLSPLIWIASLVAVVLVAFVFYNELTIHQRPAATVAALPSNTSSPPVASNATPDASPASDAPTASLSASPSAAPSDDSTPGASASPSVAPSGSPVSGLSGTLELRLSGASWVRVAVDGNVSMEGTFPAGTTRSFHGKTAVLRIGNAGGVEILVDGKDVGPLGKAGDVVERSFTL